MKDTIDFLKNSIEYQNFEIAITRFFDEHMALYNLVGSCSTIQNINGIMNDSSIAFKLQFSSNEDAITMYNLIKDKIICVFGTRYKPVEILEESSIIVNF